jgi:membrane protein implicated in regulation of membrane protease activity
MRGKRLAGSIIGGALVIAGAVWIVQGVGVLKGSFMTGQRFWTWMGAAAVAVGLVLIVSANGKRQPR